MFLLSPWVCWKYISSKATIAWTVNSICKIAQTFRKTSPSVYTSSYTTNNLAVSKRTVNLVVILSNKTTKQMFWNRHLLGESSSSNLPLPPTPPLSDSFNFYITSTYTTSNARYSYMDVLPNYSGLIPYLLLVVSIFSMICEECFNG